MMSEHETGSRTPNACELFSTEESGVSVHDLAHLSHQLDARVAHRHVDALWKQNHLLQHL